MLKNLFTALAIVFFCGNLMAANMIQNGTFDVDLTHWQLADSADSAERSSEDADGLVSSGSALLMRNAGHFFSGTALEQCVSVEAGMAYSFGGSILIPDGQASAGTVSVRLSWRASADCSGDAIAVTETEKQTATGEWTAVESVGVMAPAGAKSAVVQLWVFTLDASALSAHFDNIWLTPGGCAPGETTLCLNEGRFRVEAFWVTESGTFGDGQAVQLTADTGYFWFFAEDNVEVLVKVLNACGFNGYYWVFASGLTNVEVDLMVTDTKNNQTNTYSNPLNTPFAPVQDTAAFASCP